MTEGKPALGADLVIPLLALAFAAYFFVSIADLAWEAKANGVIIGSLLVALTLAQVVRIGLAVAKRRASLSMAPLAQPREAWPRRIALVAVAVAFIVTIPWLGLTLGLLLHMAAALWFMGVRNAKVVAAISFVVAASAYLLFIAALDSSFPRGPVEEGIAALAAKR